MERLTLEMGVEGRAVAAWTNAMIYIEYDHNLLVATRRTAQARLIDRGHARGVGSHGR